MHLKIRKTRAVKLYNHKKQIQQKFRSFPSKKQFSPTPKLTLWLRVINFQTNNLQTNNSSIKGHHSKQSNVETSTSRWRLFGQLDCRLFRMPNISLSLWYVGKPRNCIYCKSSMFARKRSLFAQCAFYENAHRSYENFTSIKTLFERKASSKFV